MLEKEEVGPSAVIEWGWSAAGRLAWYHTVTVGRPSLLHLPLHQTLLFFCWRVTPVVAKIALYFKTVLQPHHQVRKYPKHETLGASSR